MPNENHYVRFVDETRVYCDDNNAVKISPDVLDFSFCPESGSNTGVSCEHREGIFQEFSSETPIDAFSSYWVQARSKPFFEKKSFFRIKETEILKVGLNIISSPKLKRPQHHDIMPSTGHVNYHNGQRDHLLNNWEWEICRITCPLT